MADNFTANAGAGGDTFAADDIGGVKFPRSKLIIGADGTNDGDVSSANPLPVTAGQVSHDSPVAGAPVRVGGRAVSADYTAVGTGDQADLISDLNGKQIVLPYAIPEYFVQGVTAAITDTTNTSVIASAGASRRNYVTSLTVTNSHATVGTVVELRDGASTVIHRGYAAPAGGGYSVTFPTPLKGTAATAVTASCITTGSNVYVSASGYTAP